MLQVPLSPWFEPQTIQTVASRYTACVILFKIELGQLITSFLQYSAQYNYAKMPITKTLCSLVYLHISTLWSRLLFMG